MTEKFTGLVDTSLSLYGAVASTAKKHPSAAALLYMDKTISYNTLITEIDRVAVALSSLGVGGGDTVTVCLPNIPQSVYAYYAVSKLNAVAHLVHPMTKPEQMRGYLKNIATKAIFILQPFLDGYPALAEELGIFVISVSPAHSLGVVKRTAYGLLNRSAKSGGTHIRFSDFIKSSDSISPNEQQKSTDNYNSEKTAVLLHSGGTSGEPKAIELSARAINALTGKGTVALGTGDVVGKYMLSVLPMFHGFGMCMGIHAMLCHGGCNAIMPKFDKDACIKLLNKNKITYMIGVPILYEALLSHPKFHGDRLKGIDVAFVGGDFVAKNLMTKFDTRMAEAGSGGRLFEGYGLTETVTVACVNTKADNRAGSVGKALPGIRVESFDGGKLLARGQSGEFYITGDTLMSRYHLNEEATAAEFFEYDGEIWAKTGDYGYVDTDGFVFFKNRLKRIIKVSGINVFPSEIENLIFEQEGVTNVCALEVSDSARGSMIKLYVSHDRQHVNTAELEKSYCDVIETKLGKYARPQRIVFLQRLPLTSVGKVDSESLKKRND